MPLTVCAATEYQSTAPTATTNRVCTAFTVCTATQQQTVAPTPTSDRSCGPCGAGSANCDRDVANGCEVNTNTSASNCGMCGRVCPLDNTCNAGACGLCTPTVVLIPASSAPPAPGGTGARCFSGPATFTAADCPVVRCGSLDTWAFSYNDNRLSFDVVTYTPSGTIYRQNERAGARYLWSTMLDGTTQTCVFSGQGGSTVTIPWSDLRL